MEDLVDSLCGRQKCIGLVFPSRTSERRGKGDCVNEYKEAGQEEGKKGNARDVRHQKISPAAFIPEVYEMWPVVGWGLGLRSLIFHGNKGIRKALKAVSRTLDTRVGGPPKSSSSLTPTMQAMQDSRKGPGAQTASGAWVFGDKV